MQLNSFFQKLTSIFLILLGLFFILAFSAHVSEEGNYATNTDYILLSILGLLPLGLGIFRWQKAKRKSLEASIIQQEKQILQLAASNAGSLTASQLSMQTNLSLKEATKHLNELQEQGYAYLLNSDTGALVYHFYGLKTENKE